MESGHSNVHSLHPHRGLADRPAPAATQPNTTTLNHFRAT